MRSKTLGLLLTAALVLVAPAAFAGLTWVTAPPGTGAPPATLGGHTMTPFPKDGRPAGYTPVGDVPSPLGGVVDFTLPPDLQHALVGIDWATWSHGYTGDVYYTGGATSASWDLPAGTDAFYFYAEPNPFGLFSMTATSGGVSTSLLVEGSAGAQYFGLYDTTGAALGSITMTSGVDFAVGEFGISSCGHECGGPPVPEPSSLGLLALGALALLARRRKA
jgi:hypothetical protein